MKKVTTLTLALFLFAGLSYAQESEFLLNIPNSTDFKQGFPTGVGNGARGFSGPFDLDADGLVEVLVTEYSGGGRVHVIENIGVDTWELVYSTPWNDSTSTTQNGRQAIGADLDGDGFGEILMLQGGGYSATNPEIASLPPGLYVYEHTGADNDYGTAAATIYEFSTDLPDRWRSDQMEVWDVDGDGIEELLLPNNGGDNRYDNWYVLSVTGDIGTGFDVWNEEERVSSRGSEDFDPIERGGGSPASIHSADLDGDGTLELSLSSFNNFNFTNGDITDADTYVFPSAGDPNVFLRGYSFDDASLFGGVVADIDGNGDDEIFYPSLVTGNVAILNYESGEDVLQVTEDNLIVDLLPGLSGLGIVTGDIDGDGSMELIGGGGSIGASAYEAGQSPVWLRIAEFNGGDPEDPANYTIEEIEYSESFDTDGSAYDTVNRDSAGVMTTYLENGLNGVPFATKLAYLGDADLDGIREVAFAIQSVDDSTFTYNEVFNPGDSTYTRTTVSATSNENRVFMRVISGGPGFTVSIDDERIIVPSDYKLHANYPNPFNPTTTIGFTLPLDKAVSVKVYDVTGRLVRTLVNNQTFAAGTHEVTWDGMSDAGSMVASGSYLYTLEYGNFRQSKTMVMIK